jgi:hypothetical protein
MAVSLEVSIYSFCRWGTGTILAAEARRTTAVESRYQRTLLKTQLTRL